jgi:hypothetical protein
MVTHKQAIKCKAAKIRFEQEPTIRNFVRKYAAWAKMFEIPTLLSHARGKLAAAREIERMDGDVAAAARKVLRVDCTPAYLAGATAAFTEWRNKHDN